MPRENVAQNLSPPAELEQSAAAFLRSILESCPDFIVLLSPDGRILFINHPVEGMDLERTIEASVFEFIAPESHDRARSCFQRVLATGQPASFESVGLGPYGRWTNYETRVGPVRHGGKIVGLTLITQDVSQRKDLERTLRNSRDKLELAIASTGIGLWSWDLETDEITWDETMRCLFEREQAPSSYAEYLALIHPDDRAHVHEIVQRAIQTGNYESCEHRVILPDGSTVWLCARGRPVHDDNGRVVRLIGGTRNISEQKCAEEALRQSEERYRSLVSALEEGVIMQAADGTFVACNASAERILGRSGSQIKGCMANDPRWGAIHEDGSPFPPDETPATRAMRTGVPQRNVIMGVSRPDGSRVWISVNAHPLVRSGDRHPHAAVVSFVDITEQRQAAAERERLLAEEREARRIRDEFITIASHELRTPLTPVLLNLQRLLAIYRREAAPSAETVLPKLHTVNRQIERLHRLIEEMLDISRITRGKMRIEREKVDLVPLIDEVVERFSEHLARSGCALRVLEPGRAVARCDRARTEQVVSSLLSNAIKYGPGKPIEITIEVVPASVRIRVKDHGIGIAPDDHERIFQRFERAASDRNYGGLGLGLWITRQVVEAMDGKIGVESRLGDGAAFVVELPGASG
ncbi:sensor histidine kinase [Polyangium aurulentum]|uniref:sensor histidine kinase n=1 Tax=Polyangium aurulentum TaxID=2567896 RepID=UPI0010AED9A2|nr:PAS domain S-box protein [Polyangium aurulentum]UQA60287.1 PAS domain S-box protein [Polyangium aurulentum]